MQVSTNDLVYNEQGVATGEIAIDISGASGKREYFVDLVARAKGVANEQGHPQRNLSVYVGDSLTDLLAMLDADVAVLVGESTSFIRVAKAFGIPIRPLASVYGTSGSDSEQEMGGKCIYRVSHWAEIDVFLFGVKDARWQRRARG